VLVIFVLPEQQILQRRCFITNKCVEDDLWSSSKPAKPRSTFRRRFFFFFFFFYREQRNCDGR
jgi:hypothetical protein